MADWETAPTQDSGGWETVEPKRRATDKGGLADLPVTAGPVGPVLTGMHAINALIDRLANRAGGAVTDFAANAGASPEVAAGAGYAANLGTQLVPTFGAGALVKGAGVGAELLDAGARRLMQSALKPTLKTMQTGQGDRAIGTMLEEGINATKGGAEKLTGKIDELSTGISDALANSGASVDKGQVASRIQDVVSKIERNNPTPQDALVDVQKVYDQFLNNGLIPKNIPVQDAQRFKQGIYQMLREKYGVIGSDTVEAQKALARGMKEEIAAAVPEVAPLNAAQGDLLNARKVLERRLATEGNSNILSLAPLGHGLGPALAFLLDKWGLSKSLAARGLYSGKEAIPENLARVVAGAGAARSGMAPTAPTQSLQDVLSQLQAGR